MTGVAGGAVSLRGLVKTFDDVRAVDGLDLDIGAGEFYSLLGESGCGKTTTLRMIAGFEDPDEGSILLDGEDLTRLPAHRRPVNTVFQSYALFPFLSVWDNVGFGLRYTDLGRTEAAAKIGRALELVEMSALAKRKPHQLSGGQQQRVALARALVLEPRVLLLDEPLGALDAKLRKQLQRELRSLQQTVRTTFVYVTHDQEEALTMSDRLAVIVAGRVEQVGTPSEVYAAPATAYVAGFLGSANLWRGRVVGGTGEATRCRVGDVELVGTGAAALGAGEEVTAMVRHERVTVEPCPAQPPAEANALVGRVTALTFQGAATLVTADCQGLVVDAQVPNVHGTPPAWLAEGESVCVRISPSALRLLGGGSTTAP